MSQITIIGPGKFGQSMASLVISNKHKIKFLTKNQEKAKLIDNKSFDEIINTTLPFSKALASSKVYATSNFDEAIKDSSAIIITLPCQSIAQAFESYFAKSQQTKHAKINIPILLCAKGIDIETCLFPYEIIAKYWNSDFISVLSGPNFASEIITCLPTATTIAGLSKKNNQLFAKLLATKYFRPYISDDPIGVSLLGALKNCVAIGAGIIESRGLGQNAKAAFITRSLFEMKKILEFYQITKYPSIRLESISGLAGLGDILLTCSSTKSRNFQIGLKIGKAKAKDRINTHLDDDLLCEGIHTLSALIKIIAKNKLDMPIILSLNQIILGKISVEQAVKGLFDRQLKTEY